MNFLTLELDAEINLAIKELKADIFFNLIIVV